MIILLIVAFAFIVLATSWFFKLIGFAMLIFASVGVITKVYELTTGIDSGLMTSSIESKINLPSKYIKHPKQYQKWIEKQRELGNIK